MLGLIIPLEGNVELKDVADDGDGSAYAGLAPLYPDGFDSIRLRRDVTAYVGDTSLIDGTPVNQEATDLVVRCYRDAGYQWPSPVCGLVVVLGLTEWGDSVEIPEDFIRLYYPQLLSE